MLDFNGFLLPTPTVDALAAASRRHGAPASSILVIDDNAAVRAAIPRMLEQKGHSVVSAADGEAGMAAYRALRPDVVIVNIGMADADGIETTMRLRRVSPDLPIIAVSGTASGDDGAFRRAARSLGATAMLRKPFGAAELIPAVARCLQALPAGAAKLPEVASAPPSGPLRVGLGGTAARPWKRQRMARRLADLFAAAREADARRRLEPVSCGIR